MEDRKEAIQRQILAIDEALLYLSENPKESYEFDSGQTKTKVTSQDVARLERLQSRLENKLANICRRKGPAEVARPAF